MIDIAMIVLYVFLAVFTYGMALAMFEDDFRLSSYRMNCASAAFMTCFTPISTFFLLFMSGFCEHGLQYTVYGGWRGQRQLREEKERQQRTARGRSS